MEYNIFRDELAIKYPAYGHALWDPSREGLDSAVQVGDVGFTQYGKFIRLFNVLLPRDHPSHENFGVPEYHEPLKLKMSRHIYSGRLSPNNFCSKAVKPDRDEFSAAEPGPAQVTFSCSKKQGAILSLPVLAHREETFARGDFARCITKRIDVWFAFARYLGLGVARMEDIILVTGRDLASSWTNVVFSENQGGEQVSFGVQVTGISSCNVQWQVPLEDIRGVAVNCGPSGQNLPEDQCIFVRGFRVRRRFRIIPRLRAAAEPTLDPDRDEDDFDEQLISTPLETDYQDPLHTLLDYLVTNAPTDCDMALVHDDDLIYIDVDLDNLQPDAVLGNLRNSRPGIWWAQCAFAEGGPEVESSAAKVATFSCDVGAALSLSDGSGAWGAVGVFEGPLAPSQIGPTSYQPVPKTWSLRRLIQTISRGLIQFDSRSTSPSNKRSVHLPIDDESQATGALNVPSTTRKRRALLVGITYCSPSNTWDPLDGPFDDVERYRELFISTYGYRPEDVCVLKDDPDFPEHSQPTRANIIRELKKLVSGAASGDRFTFFYSGHSGQRPTVNDREVLEDGMDEMIMPSDEQPIIDDELKAILVPIPVGCNLLAILDTCHSGTLLDLPHYHCNSVYVPWESKGNRRTMTKQNINVRRQATDRDCTNSEAPRSIEATFDNQPGGEPRPVRSHMGEGQLQLAMVKTDGRIDRDKRGLFSNVTEDTEMETFALTIPGSFDEECQKVWDEVFKAFNDGVIPDNATPEHPPSDTIYNDLCQRIGRLLATCANRGGLFANEDARLGRIDACINVIALLMFKARAKLDMFGEIGGSLGELGLADIFSASAASPTGGTHSLLTARWTCISLVAIRQMLKVDLLSELAQYAVSGLACLQSPFATSDEAALASAEAIDRRLEGAWNYVEELDRAFEPLDPSKPIPLPQVKEILSTHESDVSGLKDIGDENGVNDKVDWRISLLQDVMDKATHTLIRQLPGVSFNEFRRTEPALVSEAFIFHSIGTSPVLPQLVFLLQQLRSLHTLGRKFRNIMNGSHTGGHEMALRSLKSINQIPVQLRRLKDPMKRQLWRLRDLRDGCGLGYTVELFFLALRQLKETDVYYKQTFEDIISPWKDSKESFGTHQILLNLICDLVIQDRGIFSNYTYPEYITTRLLRLTVDILDGYQSDVGHVEAALRELQGVPRQQCFDRDFQSNAINQLRGIDAVSQDEGHVPAT